MAAIRIYRRLQDLQDVDPNGLPQSGVPRYHTDVSSFVVETIAGGAGGSFSLGASNIGNTLGDTGVTGTRVVLAGIGNLTLSQSTDANGGTISISGGTAAAGGVAISASNSLFSSGTVVLSGVGGGATVNTAPGTIQISVAAPVAQTVQTQNRFNLTLDGNTAGALQEVSSGTLTLAGGNGVTLSQNGNAITISGNTFSQSVQPETQTFIGGVAASNTTYTSGTVSIVGSGMVTVQSGTGQRVIINATQTGTQFSAGLTNSGNTSGDTGTVGGRLLLVGTNNITLSGSTNGASMTITLSGPSVAGAQTGISGIGASNTTYTSGTVIFTGVGGGITVSSNTGQRVDLSVAAQSVESQSIGMSNIGNTSGTTGIASGGQVRFVFAGGNNITLSQSLNGASGTITISAPNAQTGISGIANSQTTYTSGTVSLSELGAITIRSTTGNQYQFSVNAQTGTQFSAGISGGNTSGDTGTVAGRLVLAGGNNITLSGSTNGASETITISAGAGGGFSGGVSNVGNTSGDTGITGSRLVFSGAQSITLSQSTNASGATIAISGASTSQSVQSLGMYAVQNTTGQSSSTTMDARTLSIAGDGAVSVGYSAGSLRISAPTQTVESQSIGMSNLGNTSGTTGIASGGQVRFLFAGGNNITLSQSLNGVSGTITISAFTQTVQTQDVLSVGVSTGGNTSGNTTVNTGSRLVFVGSNGITASQGTAAGATTITLSGRDPGSAGMSTQGNTAGDTGFATQRLNLVGGNNITLSGSTNGGSMTISIAAPSPGAAQYSVGVSNLGNTAGSTGVTGTRIVFAGTNNISLSQSTDATGATISINNTVSAFQAGVSTAGNTAGDTGVTGTRMVFAGSSPITLSQATGANGGTITIQAPATSSLVGTNGISVSTNGSTISVMPITQTSFAPYDEAPIVTGQQGQGTLHFMPMALPNIQFDRIALGVQISNATNSSNSFTVSQWVGIYTKNASSLSLVASTSGNTNFSGSGTVGSYSLYAGPKHMTIPWTTTLTASDYYVGIIMRTTTGGGAGHSVSQLLQSKFTNSAWSGILGAGSNATDQRLLGQGVWTVSTSGIPNSVAFTDINGSGSLVLRSPIWHLRSGTV